MTTISILPEKLGPGETVYRAIAGKTESVGKTAGEALDALTSQLAEQEAGTLVVVQHRKPDHFFTAQQQRRLEELMQRWREARDRQAALPAAEQAELDALVAQELHAAARRAQALAGELGP